MEKKLTKPSQEKITQFSKDTAIAMMQAMGQAKVMGLLKTDEDMMDLIAVGLVETLEQFIEMMEEEDDTANNIII